MHLCIGTFVYLCICVFVHLYIQRTNYSCSLLTCTSPGLKHCCWSVEPVEGGEEDDAVVGESDAEEEDDDQMVCSCIILKLSAMVRPTNKYE